MTSKVPFLARFATPLAPARESAEPVELRASNTEKNSFATVSSRTGRDSRFTRVRNETTDDE
jgi:hypothetical protein